MTPGKENEIVNEIERICSLLAQEDNHLVRFQLLFKLERIVSSSNGLSLAKSQPGRPGLDNS